MSEKKNYFIHSKQIEEYPYPSQCPFNTRRPAKLRETLESMNLLDGATSRMIPARPATDEELLMYHTRYYIDTLRLANEGSFDIEWLAMGLGTGDCPVFEGMFEYNIWAAGASIVAAEKIIEGSARTAYNPSGGLHHAFPDRAAGFCYINDVVLAIMTLAKASRRVLFLDIDVHHTDGVENAFYDRSDVMTISMHETGRHLFPGTGALDDIGIDEGLGYTVNLPMPPGTYDAAYMRAFRQAVLPLIHFFDPDVIALEVGADALAGDPLAHLCLTNNTHADIINLLLAFGKPILMTGGGGYNFDNTVRTWALCWAVLCGEEGGPDAMAGMGGVMLETTEWADATGLRDRVLQTDQRTKELIEPEIDEIIEYIKNNVFKLHGI